MVENALSSCKMGGESETGQSSDSVMGAIKVLRKEIGGKWDQNISKLYVVYCSLHKNATIPSSSLLSIISIFFTYQEVVVKLMCYY